MHDSFVEMLRVVGLVVERVGEGRGVEEETLCCASFMAAANGMRAS